MIGIFRYNNPLTLLLLLFLGWASIFLKQPHFLPYIDNNDSLIRHYFMSFLSPLEAQNHIPIKLFKFLLLFGEALYFNKIVKDLKMIEKSNSYFALTFLVISFFIPFTTTFFLLLINAALLLAIDAIIKMYKKINPLNDIIYAGFLIAIATMLTNNYMIFYGWLTISFLIIRPNSLREWCLLNIGFLLPYYFLIGMLYLYDGLRMESVFQFNMPSFKISHLTTIASIKLFILVLLPMLGIAVGYTRINMMNLQNRKAYIIMLAFFLGTVLVTILNLNRLSEYTYLLLLPVSFLFAPFFMAFRKDFIPNLILMLLIVLCFVR